MDEEYLNTFKSKALKYFPDALYIVLLILAVSIYPLVKSLPSLIEEQQVLGASTSNQCENQLNDGSTILFSNINEKQETTIVYQHENKNFTAIFDSSCQLLFEN